MLLRLAHFAVLLCAAAMLLAQAGCVHLGLGGRTTYVQEAPETVARVAALETRVAALERILTRTTSVETLPPATPSGGF